MIAKLTDMAGDFAINLTIAILIFVATLFVAKWAAGAARKTLSRVRGFRHDPTVLSFAVQVVRVVVIIIGMTGGDRISKAWDIALGCIVGVLVGDLLFYRLGDGGWQIAVIVAGSLLIASFFSSSVLVNNQAAIGAILIATIMPPGAEVTGIDFTPEVAPRRPGDPARIVASEPGKRTTGNDAAATPVPWASGRVKSGAASPGDRRTVMA